MSRDLSNLLNGLTAGSVAAVFLVAFAVSASGSVLTDTMNPGSAAVSASSQSDYDGYVQVNHQRDVDGDGSYETIDTYKGHNLVVDQGLNFFECVAGGVGCPSATTAGTASGSDNAEYITLSQQDSISGSDSTADDTTLTDLPGEITTGGLARSQGTVGDNGVGNYSVSHTFTATSNFDTDDIEWTGLHWAGNGGDDDLVAYNHFPGVTMLADDKLTIEWVEVSFSR